MYIQYTYVCVCIYAYIFIYIYMYFTDTCDIIYKPEETPKKKRTKKMLCLNDGWYNWYIPSEFCSCKIRWFSFVFVRLVCLHPSSAQFSSPPFCFQKSAQTTWKHSERVQEPKAMIDLGNAISTSHIYHLSLRQNLPIKSKKQQHPALLHLGARPKWSTASREPRCRSKPSSSRDWLVVPYREGLKSRVSPGYPRKNCNPYGEKGW